MLNVLEVVPLLLFFLRGLGKNCLMLGCTLLLCKLFLEAVLLLLDMP